MNEFKEELEYVKNYLEQELNYKVAYIAVYGSQNYNLHTENSDLDMRAIVVPNLDQLVKNSKPVSKTIKINEKLNKYMIEQVDVKDIRKYFEVLEKGNPAYVEIFYTDYYLVDENFKEQFDFFFDNMDDFVYSSRAKMIKALMGMSNQKSKRYDKKQDSKDLFHLVRLWTLMIKYYILGKNYKQSIFYDLEEELFSTYHELLMKIKSGTQSEEELLRIKAHYINNIETFVNVVLKNIDESKIDYSIKYNFRDKVHSIIKENVLQE